MRLQKFLAHAGIASRRAAEELIKKGQVKVNGQAVRTLGTEIDEEADDVEFQGKKITINQNKIYLALNKPTGYICSASDSQGKSILSLIKTKERIYPVGRLDKDSSGLILLTNDGEFANKIIHPRYGCEKEYFVVLDRELKQKDIDRLQAGMYLDGKKLKPAKVTMAKNGSAKIIIHEGIYHQIRRLLGILGYQVIKLKRIRIGKLELGNLKEGTYKKFTPEDIIKGKKLI